MSEGRLINFISISVGIFLLFFASFMGGQILDPTRDVVEDELSEEDKYGGQKAMDQMFAVITRWLPLIGGGGLIIIGLAREYQRQKVTGLEQGPRI